MKNSQRGFVVPPLIIIIAILVVGGGVYIYSNNKKTEIGENSTLTTPTPENSNSQNSQQTNPNLSVTLDLSSSYAQQFKTKLTEAFKQPANFNGHYVVASIGCGTGCFGYAVIDKNTGKVYQVPTGNDLGQFTGDIGNAYNLNSNQIKVITENGSKIKTYKFNENSFTLVSNENTISATNASWKTYTESNISIQIPQNLSFQSGVPRVLGGCAKGFSIGNPSAGVSVLSFYKYNDQGCFDENQPNFTSQYSDWKLTNGSYTFNGITGKYYSNKNSGSGAIILPSKIIEIYVESTNFSKVSAADLEKILASIKF